VFENEVLRRRVGPKRKKLSEPFNAIHNEEYSDVYRRVKSRKLRWAGHVARMEETRNVR
jgi:hypothetical protein